MIEGKKSPEAVDNVEKLVHKSFIRGFPKKNRCGKVSVYENRSSIPITGRLCKIALAEVRNGERKGNEGNKYQTK